MLNVVSFTFNAFEEHTYLVVDDQKRCWIIDPGMYTPEERQEMTGYISDHDLKPQAIINTHAHLDHILSVQFMKDRYQIPFGIHRAELPVLEMAQATASMYGFYLPVSPRADCYIADGKPFAMGDEQCTVFLTPGHSPGSISFYYGPGNWLISGDVLFAGSIGRTDLPGGNLQVLLSGIRTHLFTLPGKTVVLPGHGNATTIAQEQQYNPFFQ